MRAALLLAPLFLILASSCQKGTETATKDKAAPNFNLQTPEGKTVKLSDLKGKVVLVNFWATWCDSCKEEKPYMASLYSNLKENPDFAFVSILYNDDINNALEYERKNSYDFPVFIDPGGKAAVSYGLTGVPESFIIDKNGKLKDKVIGPMDWSAPQVALYFQNLLKE